MTTGGGSTRRVPRFSPAQQSRWWLLANGTGVGVLGRSPEVPSPQLGTCGRKQSWNRVLSMKCHSRLGRTQPGGEGREREAQERALGENECLRAFPTGGTLPPSPFLWDASSPAEVMTAFGIQP